ncbi:MAG: hypothetical protein V2J24_22675 [Pseudomonadales bacterium]|jgi:Cu/Zn superoxide dismutase|nr:hypothetical protein [Pseudomonadales bacterium]
MSGRRRTALVTLACAVCAVGCNQPEPAAQTVRVQAAIVQLLPLQGRTASGILDLSPIGGGLAVEGELQGLRGELYELRAHRLGDCTDPRGRSAGEEYAFNDPVTGRDVDGSMVTIESNPSGEVTVSGRFRGGRLSGALSLRGRSVVLHRIDREEDGSVIDTRVACGVVGIAREGDSAG